jgi:hypothetical protein
MKKLVEVQKALKAPKGQFNKFGNYHYRSCEDILEGVKPLLAEQGLIMTISDDVVLIGERYYIKATATITDADTLQRVSNTAFARETETRKGMDESQVTGSASSYARKYALNGLLLIDDTKDADTRDNNDIEIITVQSLLELAKEKGATRTALEARASKELGRTVRLEELTQGKIKEYYKKLQEV